MSNLGLIRALIRQAAILLQADEEQPEKPKDIIVTSKPLTLFHVSKDEDLTSQKLNFGARTNSRQGRGGRERYGLYAVMPKDVKFFKGDYGSNVYALTFGPKLVIKNTLVAGKGKTSRIDKATCDKLLEAGVDVLIGQDLIGPREFVILNGSKLTGFKKVAGE